MKIPFTNSKVFLRWWVMLSLISLGSVVLYVTNIFHEIAKVDVTYLSFLIYILFVGFSIRTGWFTYKVGIQNNLSKMLSRQDVAWFASDAFLTLGMLGTVIGILYMLALTLTTLDPSNPVMMKMAIKSMGTGMCTALYTTATGLICGLALKVQLFNLTHYLEEKLESEEK